MPFAAGSKPVGYFKREAVLERHERIVALAREGLSVVQIAERIGYTDRGSIYNHMSRKCRCGEYLGVPVLHSIRGQA